MAHFPAGLRMIRLAGSSGPQNVCETTKVQEQDGRQALEETSRAPPARPKRRHHCTVSLGARRPVCQ